MIRFWLRDTVPLQIGWLSPFFVPLFPLFPNRVFFGAMSPGETLIQFVLLDWVWIGLFIGLMILCGVIFYRLGKRSEADFFLAGRGLPWWLPATSMRSVSEAGRACVCAADAVPPLPLLPLFAVPAPLKAAAVRSSGPTTEEVAGGGMPAAAAWAAAAAAWSR